MSINRTKPTGQQIKQDNPTTVAAAENQHIGTGGKAWRNLYVICIHLLN
jgi:hypothetical protein